MSTSAAGSRDVLASLHVAVDCRVIDPHFPGIGRATLETVRALVTSGRLRRVSLLTTASPPHDLGALLSGARDADVRLVHVPAALRSAADQLVLPSVLAALKPDVYHATYYAVPACVPAPLIVTVYDLIPRLFPQYWPNPRVRAVINAWTAYAVRRAARVIACSESTARDIARLFPRAERKVRVAPLGVAPAVSPSAPFMSTRSEDDQPYLLYVGSNKPHKNLTRLVAAFARLNDHVPARLVIAGAWDARYPESADAVRRCGLATRITFERQPSESRLRALYAGASGFVFPSLYEGFGLPILEAMAAGVPVMSSDRGSLREVAGDAALLFDPEDEGSMASTMRRLLEDAGLRERLSISGRERAARFTWSRTAEAITPIYEEVACGSSTCTKTSTP